VNKALIEAEISMKQLSAIAFTNGPGLKGSLLVGASFAKSISLALNIPLIEVNHMKAHILAHYIYDSNNNDPKFPFIGLTISGGHTQIVKVDDHLSMTQLGTTLDDAVGEAFDKSGKVIGLKYPAGPEIDKLAKSGDPLKYKFTKPMVKDLDFSFSGLKTNFLNFINKEKQKNFNFINENINDICASLQKTIVDILLEKIILATKITGISTIAIGGGVSANSQIRNTFLKNAKKYNWKVHIPNFSYTTDNAAMIAITGLFKYNNKMFSELSTSVNPRLKI
jgi:N6-L-threonylcarbamoyladenine synthase